MEHIDTIQNRSPQRTERMHERTMDRPDNTTEPSPIAASALTARDRNLLRNLFLFRQLDELPQDLPDAAAFEKGGVIYSSDRFRRSLGILLSGRAEARSMSSEDVTLTSFAPGDVFGAAALFCEDAYISVIRAVTKSRVLFLPEPLLLKWFSDVPRIAENYIRFLTGRIRFLNRKIAIFTDNSVEGRLYRHLWNICDENGRIPPPVNMTRLASQLSVGRTSLYRALKALEEKEKIRYQNGRIEVLSL